MTTDDPDAAFQIYNQLQTCNNERKAIQAEVFEEAKEQVLSQMYGNEHLISIACAPHWHEGVVGIVASKLVETFKVPAIVLCRGQEGNGLKGSARNVNRLNIYRALSQCSDLFSKFGGHQAAAGLSMPEENLPEFKSRLQQYMTAIPAIERIQQDHFDLAISIDDISPELGLELEQLEPFGSGNGRPVFQMRDAVLESYQILKEHHVRWSFRSLRTQKKFQGISFFFVGKWGGRPSQRTCGQGSGGVDRALFPGL